MGPRHRRRRSVLLRRLLLVRRRMSEGHRRIGRHHHRHPRVDGHGRRGALGKCAHLREQSLRRGQASRALHRPGGREQRERAAPGPVRHRRHLVGPDHGRLADPGAIADPLPRPAHPRPRPEDDPQRWDEVRRRGPDLGCRGCGRLLDRTALVRVYARTSRGDVRDRPSVGVARSIRQRPARHVATRGGAWADADPGDDAG